MSIRTYLKEEEVMKKIVWIVLAAFFVMILPGCTKKEADVELAGDIEYMPYERVESVWFSSVNRDVASSQDLDFPEEIRKDEDENDLKKIYNVLYCSEDSPYDEYESQVTYSGGDLSYVIFSFEVHKRDVKSDEWLEDSEYVSVRWDVETGRLSIVLPSYYDVEGETTYIEKYINTQSADVLEEMFFKYL